MFTLEIPPHFGAMTFDSYPVTEQTAETVAQIRDWVRAPIAPSLFIFGQYGCGKTGLAVCAMADRVQQTGCDAYFTTTPNLLDRIRSTYAKEAKGDESQVLDALKRATLLVLDDLGAERVTDWVSEKLFTLINHRHDHQLATIITSNLSLAELNDRLDPRIAWRIAEMSAVAELNGPNLRVPREA